MLVNCELLKARHQIKGNGADASSNSSQLSFCTAKSLNLLNELETSFSFVHEVFYKATLTAFVFTL